MMRIGIDARFLTHPQRGGFKTYTESVIQALSLVDVSNEYIIYTDRVSDEVPILPSNFEIKPVAGVNALLREQVLLPFFMKLDEVDIAHFPCNTAPILLWKRMVVTIHDAMPFRNTRRRASRPSRKQALLSAYWRAVIPKGAARSRLVVTVSEGSREDLTNTLKIPKQKIRVVRNAVDSVFSIDAVGTPPAGITPGTQFILAFANMDGRKNHQMSIQAYEGIRKDFPGLKLALVCSHPDLRRQLKQRCSDGVIPVGPLDTEELVWLYVNGLCLCFPSLDEGFGLPTVEAMSCGMPVVAANTGAIPEVVGDSAILVDPTDPLKIADALKDVLTAPIVSTGLVERGLKRAALHRPERLGAALVSLYSEAAGLAQAQQPPTKRRRAA